MKLGVCTNMIATADDRLGLSHLNEIAGAGFDYVELSMAAAMSLDREGFRGSVERIRGSALKCEVVCSLMRPDIRVVGDEYDENRLRDYIKETADRASVLGVKAVVLGSPLSRSMVSPPYSLEDTLCQLAQSVQVIMDILDAYGIPVLLEPLNRTETNVINTFEQSAGFCRQVNRKGFSSMIDFAHFRVNGEPYSSIGENGEMLSHVHISRPFQRRFPVDEGEEDYAGFMEALKKADYDGTMSIEAVSKDVAGDALAASRLLRGLIKRFYEV